MKLSEVGEFNLIEKITQKFTQELPTGVVGIGDDCAVIPQENGRSLLVTTDMLVENTHFLKHETSPEDLGYKTLAVNLSDIAGMGGTPKYAFLSMALPDNLSEEWVVAFLDGFRELALSTGTLLLGGDTTKCHRCR